MPGPQDYIAYLVSKGVPQIAATAAVARFQQESGHGLNPTIVGDKSIPGGSVGLGQWNRERKQGLIDFAGQNWSDPYKQLDYFIHEGQGPERGAFGKLLAAKSPEAAAQAMMDYERPQGWVAGNPTAGHGYGNTLKNYYALAGQPLPDMGPGQPDGPKGQEMWPDRTSLAASMAQSARPRGPVEAAGGGVGSEAGAGAQAPVAAPAAATWWQNLGKQLGKLGVTGGIGDIQPARGGAPIQQPARIDQPDVATIDPQANDQQRQMLAMAMQRLNSGRLF